MNLTRIERRGGRDAFDAMYPAGADLALPMGISELDVDGYVDALTRAWPWRAMAAFRVTAVLIGLAPLFVLRTLAPFHRLDAARRLRVLEALARSRVYVVRQMVTLFKASAGLLYGAAPAVRRALAIGVKPAPEALFQLRLMTGGRDGRP